ncbi:MAG: hypothetical protein HZA46_16400, partial [Planctomycetales bacterium]|nr:hypothetical protein [Planctomycetales bacterium]
MSGTSPSRRLLLAQIVAYALAWIVVLYCEVARLPVSLEGPGGILGWLVGFNQQTTPFIPLLLIAPLAWIGGVRLIFGMRGDTQESPTESGARPADQVTPSAARRRGKTKVLAQTVSSPPAAPTLTVVSSSATLDASGSLKSAVWLSVCVAALSLGQSAFVGQSFDDMPPAVHDEYSYLFQAQTFLAGRVWFPSSAEPRLFDQMHVV